MACVRFLRLTQLNGSGAVVHADTGQLAGSPRESLETDSFTSAATVFPEDDAAQLWVDGADGVIPALWEPETLADGDIKSGVLTLEVILLEDVNLTNTSTGSELSLVIFFVHLDNWSLFQLLHFKVVGHIGVNAWLLDLFATGIGCGGNVNKGQLLHGFLGLFGGLTTLNVVNVVFVLGLSTSVVACENLTLVDLALGRAGAGIGEVWSV